ncbi:MAG: mechanosensitive ion channel [Deltaproteobacteria bacterium]|jgi:small-conductance mechanosensitive channel|nr:mechanosensitive ion channel [Deltaproteobacteria bacterium]
MKRAPTIIYVILALFISALLCYWTPEVLGQDSGSSTPPAQAQGQAQGQDSGSSTPPAQAQEGAQGQPEEAPPVPTTDSGDTSVTESNLNALWTERTYELRVLMQDTQEMLDGVSRTKVQFQAMLNNAESDYNRLLSIYQLSSNHPLEQEDILRQLMGLKAQIQNKLRPLQDNLASISQKQNDLAALGANIQSGTSGTPSSQEEIFLLNFQQANDSLKGASDTLNALLKPGQDLLLSLDKNITSYQESFPQTWKDYYFTSSSLTSTNISDVMSTGSSIAKWFIGFSSRAIFFYPQTSSEWLGSLTVFFLGILVMLFLRYLVLRIPQNKHLKIPYYWHNTIDLITGKPWACLTLGVALVFASHNNLGGSFICLALPGVLLLIWGLASVSWMLRIAALKSREDKEAQEKALAEELTSEEQKEEENTSADRMETVPPPEEGAPSTIDPPQEHTAEKLRTVVSPLHRFFYPAAIGVILLYIDAPSGALTIIWYLVLGLFLYKLWKVRSLNKDSGDKLPLMERFFYGSAVCFSIISLIISLAGYARLAILFFMVLFTLVNFFILGYAFKELGVILCDQIFPKEAHRVKNAILGAFMAPLAWALALLSALPWLKAAPGCYYLIQSFLSKGYTVGTASFDLTKIIFVIALFLVFKSIRKIADHFLTQLVRTMPQQKMVIQPAIMLLPFVLWTIFAIIGLGLLGVNLTGLVVLFSTLSLGVGLAFQTLFQNLISGIILIFGRSVIVGDWVEVGTVSGEVRSVGIRCTIIETSSHAEVMVPNSVLVSNQLTNWTRNGKKVRKMLSIKTFYGTDVTKTLNLLLQAAYEDKERILQDTNKPSALLNDFNEKCLEFNLYVSIKDIDLAYGTMSDLRRRIEKALRLNGIRLYEQSLDINLSELPLAKKETDVSLDKKS